MRYRFEVLSQEAKFISAAKIFLMFKKKFRKVHPQLDERIKVQATDTYKFLSTLRRKYCLQQSKKVLLDFLEVTSFRYNMCKKAEQFHGAVFIIRREFLKRIKLHKERMRILRDNWKGEVERQLKQQREVLSKQKKDKKKIKKELKKLGTISDHIRDTVIKKYYEYIKLEQKLKMREFENEMISRNLSNKNPYKNDLIIVELEEKKRKLFGRQESNVLEIDLKISTSQNQAKTKHTVGFGATKEDTSILQSSIIQQHK